jgi:hypothetical protein
MLDLSQEAVLNAEEQRKMSFLFWKSNPGSPASSLSLLIYIL